MQLKAAQVLEATAAWASWRMGRWVPRWDRADSCGF